MEAIRDLEKRSRRRNLIVNIDSEILTGTGVYTGDMRMIVRVLVNLIENGFRASKAGDLRVIVRIEKDESELCLYVENFGSKFENSLFEKAISQKGHTQNFDGHGLGLHFSQNYLLTVGSCLRLVSDMEKTSVFFRLAEYKN